MKLQCPGCNGTNIKIEGQKKAIDGCAIELKCISCGAVFYLDIRDYKTDENYHWLEVSLLHSVVSPISFQNEQGNNDS